MASSERMTAFALAVEAREMCGFWNLKRSLDGELEFGEEKKIEEEKNETEEYGGADADILAVREKGKEKEKKHCVYCLRR